jgi:NAD+ dependent glucose-6-phosphate dehydrogenase
MVAGRDRVGLLAKRTGSTCGIGPIEKERMNQRRKVLVTGGAGLIGSILLPRLEEHYEVTSFDLRPAPGVRSIVGDLTQMEATEAAFAGQDAVVHLAADRSAEALWDSALRNNVVATYHVFEAARRTGVKRVVFASSQHATGAFYREEPWKHIVAGEFSRLQHGGYPLLDENCPIRPDGYYGVSKACGEALGSYYLDYHNLSSIHLRIGWVLSENDPTFSPFALSLWLSQRDLGQIMRCSLETPRRFGIYYATSDNRWKIWDIRRAKAELGYAPADGAGEQFVLGLPPVRDR